MPRKRRGKTSPQAIESRRKQREAFELRKSGFTLAEIGARLKVHASTVHDWIRAGLEEGFKEGREQLAAVNYSRLEEVIKVNYEMMTQKDPVCTANYIKAVQELNRMLGMGRGGSDGQTINFNIGGSDDGKSQIPGDLHLHFVSPPKRDDDPIPLNPYQRAIEHIPASDPPPRYDEPLRSPPPRSNEARAPHRPPPDPNVNARSFAAKPPGPNEPRTELEVPLHQRFGFGTDDKRSVFPPPKKKADLSWMA